MATLFMEFGEGFALNGAGGLALAQGWDETRQAGERIALTTALTVDSAGTIVPPEYLDDVTFGLSSRIKIGELLPGQAAAALGDAAKAAFAVAPGADPNHPPDVAISQPSDHTFLVNVTVYLTAGGSETLSYTVQ
jgi:hypothetical protein